MACFFGGSIGQRISLYAGHSGANTDLISLNILYQHSGLSKVFKTTVHFYCTRLRGHEYCIFKCSQKRIALPTNGNLHFHTVP